jgi:hypothetical protein
MGAIFLSRTVVSRGLSKLPYCQTTASSCGTHLAYSSASRSMRVRNDIGMDGDTCVDGGQHASDMETA